MLKAALLLTFLQVDVPPPQEKVNKALDDAAHWLLEKAGSGLPNDVSINAGKGLRVHSLVLYALHHAGVEKENPTFRRLLQDVAKQEITTTYMAATTAMALEAIDKEKYPGKIWECGQFLVDSICTNGQWSYGRKYDMPEPPPEDKGGGNTRAKIVIKQRNPVGPKTGDNSNSQYAALGIYACWKAGFDFEKSLLDRAIAWWETHQKGDGSWDYADQGVTKAGDPGFGSMTAGGGSSVILLRKSKGQRVKSTKARLAITWCGASFSVRENPNAPEDRKRFHYYYLYALERLGDLYPMEKMGRHKWYAQGANWLLENQKSDGSWEGEYSPMRVSDTCFAILFLRRATKVATGDRKK